MHGHVELLVVHHLSLRRLHHLQLAQVLEVVRRGRLHESSLTCVTIQRHLRKRHPLDVVRVDAKRSRQVRGLNHGTCACACARACTCHTAVGTTRGSHGTDRRGAGGRHAMVTLHKLPHALGSTRGGVCDATLQQRQAGGCTRPHDGLRDQLPQALEHLPPLPPHVVGVGVEGWRLRRRATG